MGTFGSERYAHLLLSKHTLYFTSHLVFSSSSHLLCSHLPSTSRLQVVLNYVSTMSTTSRTSGFDTIVIHDTHKIVHTALILNVVFLPLATAAIVLRMWSRMIMKQAFSVNDYLLVASWVYQPKPFTTISLRLICCSHCSLVWLWSQL